MADFTLSAKITGDASNFEKAISSAERSLSNIGKLSSNLGSKLTNSITKPALAAGTALAGITLVKGWSRLTALDDARAKLQAIGNTAEDVEQIMADAMASVKGTAFGMDEAATTAASAVAAGIEPGKKLQQYLTSVADAAAVAGTDMESMGAIFNKVATQGKANNEVLQQLAEKGIPIYQYLADETGKTAEEIFELARDGEISLATFQSAVETHINGAAVAMGDATLSGAIDNMMASISRIGANFLGSSDDASTFGGQVRELLIDLRKNVLEPLEAKAADLGKVFGEFFAKTVEKIKSFISSFQEMNKATEGALGRFTAIGGAGIVALGPILKIAGSISTALSMMGPKITALLGPIAAVAAAIMLMWKNSETFRDGVMSVVAAVLPVLQSLFNAIMPIIQTIGQEIGEIAGIVGNVIGTILQIVSPFITLIGSAIAGLVEGIGSTIGGVVSIFSDVFGGVIDFLTGIFTGDWEKAWNGVKEIFSGIWDGLKAVAAAPLNAIIGLANGVIGGLNKISITIPDWSPVFPGKKLGFDIPKIPYLKNGTDDWQGGLAYMNEGGKGELVNLPNGSQVIPHDISIQYAREAAKANYSTRTIDIESILDGIVINVYNQTTLDGTPLMEKAANHTIKKITNQQRNNMIMKGKLV